MAPPRSETGRPGRRRHHEGRGRSSRDHPDRPRRLRGRRHPAIGTATRPGRTRLPCGRRGQRPGCDRALPGGASGGGHPGHRSARRRWPRRLPSIARRGPGRSRAVPHRERRRARSHLRLQRRWRRLPHQALCARRAVRAGTGAPAPHGDRAARRRADAAGTPTRPRRPAPARRRSLGRADTHRVPAPGRPRRSQRLGRAAKGPDVDGLARRAISQGRSPQRSRQTPRRRGSGA